MKTTPAFIGALIALAGILVPFLAAGLGPLALAVVAATVIVGYLVGRYTAGTVTGDVVRGLLIGANSGLNVALMLTIGGAVLGDAAAIVLAATIGLINLLAVFATVSENAVYQGFLGWFNWLMPMSWLVVGLGLIFYVLSVLGHLLVYLISRRQSFRIIGLAADWKTGTWFMHGGWVANANPIDTAFNMGNFAFVDAASSALHIDHEAGHTLNLGAFGSVFHFVGAIDENVTGGGASAFSERLAESHNPGTTQADVIPMWI